MSSIDPIRRAERLRRAARARAEEAASAGANLPVPAEPARTHASRRPAPLPTDAAFDAHLLGQAGEKRGLRAGPALIDRAAQSYNRAEYSGAKDRRQPKGAGGKTEI
jgi:hypothetical protein